jgi:hypothetical protein
MKTMKLIDLLAERESGYGPEDLGMTGDEQVYIPALVDPRSDDLTVWAWASDDARGFLRDDSSGFRAIADTTREAQLTLAAWNVDFDIRLLKDFLSEEDLLLALEDAQENEWGFDADGNRWGND